MNKRKKEKIEKFLEELTNLTNKTGLWFCDLSSIQSGEGFECEIKYDHENQKYKVIYSK